MTIRNYSEMRFERSRDEIKSEFIYLETDKRKVDDVDLTLEITLISAGVGHTVIVRNRLQRLSVRGYESIGRGALQHINRLQYLIENIKEIEGESLRMVDIIDDYQVQWNVFDNIRELDEAQYDDQCSTYNQSILRVIKVVSILRTDDLVLERVVIRGLR